MNKTRLARREREKLAHRKDILKTAVELFSEKGFHNVSMQEIAQKAEFAVGTLYNFFKDKEDLYKALVREQAEAFHLELTEAIETGADECEKIRNYVVAKGEVFSKNAPMIRLYLTETQGARLFLKAGLDCDIRKSYEEFLLNLSAVFESGIRKKKIKKLFDPYYMAVALDSLTTSFLFLWLDNPEGHPYSQNVDALANMFLEK